MALVLEERLNEAIAYPSGFSGDRSTARFHCFQLGDMVEILDHYLAMSINVSCELLQNPRLDFRDWYAHAALRHQAEFASPEFELDDLEGELTVLFASEPAPNPEPADLTVELNAAQPGKRGKKDEPDNLTVQRNAAIPRDLRRVIPEPIVVVVLINGQPACALLDTGSLADFMSAKLAHQLKVDAFELAKPMPLHLAVQGSRAKINYGCTAQIEYQSICAKRYFDIINLLNYDVILGTPFFYQHRVLTGFNPTKVVIGSTMPLAIEGKQARVLESRAAEMFEDRLEAARAKLREYAAPICKEASDSPLPPLRAINHAIPLKDESKIYSWRPSRCPDALRHLWSEKREAYLKSGRWKMTNARNTSPMLLLTKPGTGVKGIPPCLRVVCDLCERNTNTHKVTSPLLDMEGILRCISRKPYRSLIDGKDAYEQIRIEPAHVPHTAMTTPDGNMVSLVLQQGDCNAVATYQTLMNHIFAPYIGVFLDVYLDDIAVYSDTLELHIKHISLVVDILRKEQLYLSASKLKFLCAEMKVLGRIVDDKGIRMDPDKVDNVLNWKVPTNRELLRGFLGSVGYLADDIATVRIPMGVLSSLTGTEISFRWEYTYQRAFDEIKKLLHAHREHHRVPLDYSEDAPRIWLVTDGSHGGVAGVVTQGDDFRKGKVAAFFSAKLSSAQMNYPVHEIEMLAGVESMRRHRDILLGCTFTWVTDHKGLTHLLKQRNLSGRQARWLEHISEFNFEVEYVPGIENVLADALSRIYAHDRPGTVRAPSEYTFFDEEGDFASTLSSFSISTPVIVDPEAIIAIDEDAPPTRVLQPRPPRVPPLAERPTRQTRVLTAVPAPVNIAATASDAPPTPVGGERKLPEPDRDGAGVVPTTLTGSITPRTAEGRRTRRARVDVPPAETGRPETAQEFSKCIQRVTLRLPNGGRQEGACPMDSANGQQPTDQVTLPDEYQPVAPPLEQENQFLSYLSQNTEGLDLLGVLKGRYTEDKFFASISENAKHFKNFLVKDGLVFVRDNHKLLLCVPDIQVNDRSAREIVIRHAHSLLAHLGTHRTLTLLRDHLWWKSMAADVQKYCETCMTCKRSKPDNQKPYGLLNPLSVPSRPWQTIAVDFVGPLPESTNRDGTFDEITTIIDLHSGMVHLVPSRQDYKAPEVAELMFAEVYRLHGMPESIVSDRDVLFTSLFWTHLNKLIGVELRMSSAYHPQSDGSAERANRTVGQMLKQCIGPNQKDWVRKLPAIEFAINLARNESTGFAPFFLNTGRMPRAMVWDSATQDEYPGVRVFAQRVKNAVMAAHDSILAARVKQTRNANRHRRPAPFAAGDLVYISTLNISLPKGYARKLAPKYIGPYRIVRDFGNSSYQIDLPSNLRRRGIHNVFHASLLRVHIPNDDRLFPGRLDSQVAELEDRDNEWAIEKIVSHRGRGGDAVFEALWKSGDRTWVPYSTVRHLGALTAYLEAMGADGVSDLDEGSGTPPSDPQVFLGFLRVPTRRHEPIKRKTLVPQSSPSSTILDSTSLPLTLELFSIAFSMPLQHSRLDPNRPGFTLLDENGVPHSWVLAQFREFVRFDRDLRSGAVSAANLIIPGDYGFFTALFNSDTDCLYQFSSFDPATNSTTVRGAPIPAQLLDELDPPPTVTFAEPAPAEPQFTPQRIRTIERMLWGSAEREARYLERRDSMQDRRTEDRKRKRIEHCAADEARASKPPPFTTATSSTGILAVAAGSSGGATILSTAAPRGSGSSCPAAGTSSGSSTHQATRREASPMEEDKDAEGEDDTELLEYTEEALSGKKKAGKGKKRQ
ncbi:hypothetical protein GSI_12079 [Ganoderma sinense ZZ0214-1]|uniref:RNA-directed DNA polymerase n=1 Tax=Ganoderma sinense ZZ0214-1 TaxID=1077348 RepID=A0A2G8RXT0_9APHY|nr:hypothetical protein GSI_12079 [Ganoderma sinense ZZ0214-1]